MRRGISPRICFVSSFPPSKGRLAEYAYQLINELHKFPSVGHIDIITDTTNHRAVEFINGKVTVHRTWKPDYLPSMLLILFKIVRLKPDVVHFNVHMAVFGHSRLVNFIGLSIPFLCRLMGFNTLVTLHNIVEKVDVDKTGFNDTFLNRLGAFLATKVLVLNSIVTLTVRSYVQVLKTRYDCKQVAWVPHGTWNNGVSNHSCEKPSHNILYIGHTGPYKDLEMLFKAFKILTQRQHAARLIIAGDSHPNYPGFLEEYRSANHSENVYFIGYVPEDELPTLFENANVVVLPYHTCTGTSGVAHLASSFGTPIVATDLPEFHELMDEGCGIVLSPRDPEAFAKTILHVLDSPDLVKELRSRNLHFARERSWSNVASMFCNIYKDLLRKREHGHLDYDPEYPPGNIG